MPLPKHLDRSADYGISRRQLIRTAVAGMCGAGMSPWFSQIARAAGEAKTPRHCILLWMTGGPSQMDTFDLKPGHENGGEFKEIETGVPGMKFSEHLPKLAQQAEHLAILRGLTTKEGDHGRGTYLMHTGHAPGAGGIRYPTIGSSLSKELALAKAELPNFVSISPFRIFNNSAHGPGFLGPGFAPLTVVGEAAVAPTVSAEDVLNGRTPMGDRFATLGVDDLRPPDSLGGARAKGRMELLRSFETNFSRQYASSASEAHQLVYERAIRLMNSASGKAFDLSQEPEELREKYGAGIFGQGCLLARRLVEHGVSFVEVSLGTPQPGSVGWDTHVENFAGVKTLSEELDAGFATLLEDLHARGLLENTTIVWMGEFGRTPKINQYTGRDHFTDAWSCVLAGGGIKGGQVHGRTSADGMQVEEGQVGVGDVLATICKAAGVEPGIHNTSNIGRPIKIADGTAIDAVLS